MHAFRDKAEVGTGLDFRTRKVTKNLFKSQREKRTSFSKSYVQSLPELRKASTHSAIDFLLDFDTNFAIPIGHEDEIPELTLRTKLSQPERKEITTNHVSLDLLNTMESLSEDVQKDIDNLALQIDTNMQLLSTWFSFLNNTGTHFLSNVRFSAAENEMETESTQKPKVLSVEPISRLFPEETRSRVNTILYDYLGVPVVICLSKDASNWVPLTDEQGNQEWYLFNSPTQEGFTLKEKPEESSASFKFFIDRNRSIRVKKFIICKQGHLHAIYNDTKYSISLTPDFKFIAVPDGCTLESDLPKVEHKVQISRMKFPF